MSPKSRISIARRDITRFFIESGRRIYRKSDINHILATHRTFWRLTQSMTVNSFLHYLLENTELKQVRVEFPNRPLVRYVWGDADDYSIIQSQNPNGYFSHYTAMSLHGLTEQVPSAIYFNQEQQRRGGGGELTQLGITRAFRGKCRITNNVGTFRDRRIFLLNGQNTGRLGVADSTNVDGETLKVTNIDRTLVDATVRPIYSGGVFEVAKAFARAQGRVSTNRLAATLRQMNFTYPYHQAIGFYLQRAGTYSNTAINLFRSFPFDFDFYLDYGMKDPDYIREWRLFVPKGF